MCYSGRCLFEDSMGNCQVWSLDYNEFEKKYGYTACRVGGTSDWEIDVYEEYYQEHEEEFKEIYKDYMKNRFNF